MSAAAARITEAVAAIHRDLQNLPVLATPSVRAVRRNHTRSLADEDGATVLEIVRKLLASHAWPERVVAYELLAGHEAAFASLNDRVIEALADGLDDWGSIDLFGVTVAGPAWRQGVLGDRKVMAWAKSKDFWRRRLS